jgi:protein TonB
MFEQSLLASTPSSADSRWPAIASIGIQTSLVITLLALPLVRPERMSLALPHLLRLVPPAPPRLPKPLPQPVRVLATLATSTPSAPATTPSTPVIHTSGQPVDEPLLALGTTIGPAVTDPSALFSASTTTSPRVVPAPGNGSRGDTTKSMLNVSGGVSSGLLLAPINPVYPQIARITRTEGTVVIQAIISKSGRIESAHVLSGPAILQASALQAVRDARYTPYLLNHEPTEVETTISIIFRLGS